jgi:ectoine hydroxylase-related dioxygenase (phytanoyl-CoA dioxygenase family)
VNEEQQYLFDLNGYIVLPNALSTQDLAAINRVIDAAGVPELLKQVSYLHTGFPPLENPNSDETAGPVDITSGLLTDWGQEFRDLVDHPRTMPLLRAILGEGMRLDHSYAIFMRKNAIASSSHHLHNGGTPFDPSQYYLVRDGQIFSTLVVVSFALTDVKPGDGGFCVIPGSHKSNFPLPKTISGIVNEIPPVVQVPLHAGDVVIFTEAVTHGSLPWNASHERRAVLYKYAQGHLQWEQQSPWANLELPWSPRQRDLLRGPYAGSRPPVQVADTARNPQP